MRRARTWITISVTLVVGAFACGPASETAPTAAPTFPPTASPATAVPPTSVVSPVPPVSSPIPGSGSSPDAAAQTAVVEAVMRDAAGRLSLASGAGDLHVQQVEARDWPDSSLGCPSPGVMYSQVVTPGYLVVVSGAGRELEYHADSRGRLVLCQQI